MVRDPRADGALTPIEGTGLDWRPMPRFSVLVPTRDRPHLLGFCLEGLAQQTFADFDVVVADNPVHAPAREVFERRRKPGWRYVLAPEPLNMADNWEFGMALVRGDFIAVVIDKWILHPTALERVDRALREDSAADLVSWWSDDYMPVDEQLDVGRGTFAAAPDWGLPARFDPDEELRKMYSFERRRGLDRIHHYRGKICFGAYSDELLDRIRARCGRVFHPLAPDYTSRVPALALTEGAIDMGRPLLLAYSPAQSTGTQVPEIPAYARSFVVESEPGGLARLPIPGLYASSHNLVAHDLASSATRLLPEPVPELDRHNLVRRAREDLDLIAWDSRREQDEQYAILQAEEARLGVTYVPAADPEPPAAEPARPSPTLRSVGLTLLQRVPPAERAARWALRRPVQESVEPPPPPTFASPVGAAAEADRLYSSVRAAVSL